MDIVFPEYEEFHTRVVFYRIPKNAGTSICEHLSHINLLNLHKRDLREKCKHPTYLKPDKFKDLFMGENLRNCFSFCVKRNPWDRVVSAYSSTDQKDSFTDFCENNKHNYFGIGKQVDWMRGNYPPNKILSFENLNEEFSKMVKNHNIINLIFNLPHKKKTEHAHYSEYYNSKTREIVEDVFKEDIDNLGYVFNELKTSSTDINTPEDSIKI